MTDARPTPCDILVHSATVLTVDAEDRIVPNGAVAIAGEKVIEVGSSVDLCRRYLAEETIDARGAAVHPGFIDAHMHVSQYSSRAALQRLDQAGSGMGDWKAALQPEDERASAALAAVDYLRCGYTGFVDPGTIFEPDAVVAATAGVGIRLWLTDPYVADRGHELAGRLSELASPRFLERWPRNTEQALARLGRQLRRNGDRNGLVRAFIGLYGEETASPELLRAAVEAAGRNGVQFQEHRGYLPASYRAAEAELGRSLLSQLQEAGVLGPGTTFIHMNVMSREDVALLAGSGTAIVWCPYGQLQMIGRGGAEPRMAELQRAGGTVALGTDIPRAINFDALGALAVANSAACGAPLLGREVLRMRTIGAARTVGAAGEVGSIEAGKQADLVVRSAGESEALGLDPSWEASVHGLRQAPEAVIVNGAIVLRNGRPLRCDPQEATAAARASVRDLLRRIGA